MEFDLGGNEDYFDNMMEMIDVNIMSTQRSILIKEKVEKIINKESLEIIQEKVANPENIVDELSNFENAVYDERELFDLLADHIESLGDDEKLILLEIYN